MKSLAYKVAAVMAGLLSEGAWAERVYVCPETIRLESAAVVPASLPEGYAFASTQGLIRLSGITVFDGPPERKGALLPMSERGDIRRKETVSLWRFEGSYPEGKYVSCDYAQGVLRVFVRLEEVVTQCVATTARKNPHDTLTARFVCR